MKEMIDFDSEFMASVKDWRRHLHANPELGFEEHKTAAFIARLLRQWGIEVHENFGVTGVIGILRKGNAKRTIGLRADIDALPINEINNVDYRSQNPDTMHACGHDGHTSMLLGAARQLAENIDFDGTVIFIFQPNEENGKGALAMIKDGLFERYTIDDVYGMHNIPGMPLGSFETRTGTLCASESLFEIQIDAKGGHAAMPHKGVDAILVGSQIVNALQSIVSRKIDPAQSAVVSVTEFISDGRRNVLPGSALLKGDVRAMNPQIRKLIEQHMERIIDGLASAHNVNASFKFESAFIEVINADLPTQHAIDAARAISDRVDGEAPVKTFSEDFAHLADQQPGCFILMGNGRDGRHGQPLHASDYDFNDDALVHGIRFWVSLVKQQLSSQAG